MTTRPLIEHVRNTTQGFLSQYLRNREGVAIGPGIGEGSVKGPGSSFCDGSASGSSEARRVITYKIACLSYHFCYNGYTCSKLIIECFPNRNCTFRSNLFLMHWLFT